MAAKAGDRGRTSLYCGTEVDKDDIRMEVCGALDEVSSFLGMAKSCCADSMTKSSADLVQKSIIVLNAEIASTPAAVGRLKKKICAGSVAGIEAQIKRVESRCGARPRSFCLQGANIVSSTLDVARAITRRAERLCVTMTKSKMLANRDILTYLNRLSELLYLLARLNEKPHP